MQHEADTSEIELLKKAIIEAITNTLGQDLIGDCSPFPLRTLRQVARIFNVSHHTVRGWTRRGLLHSHYQILSGRSCRLVFANNDLLNFFDENFPSAEDIRDHPCDPRRGSKSARLIAAMFKMNALYSRRRQRVEEDEEG